VNDKLKALRAELDNMIDNGMDSVEILKKSQELDVEIFRFYKDMLSEDERP